MKPGSIAGIFRQLEWELLMERRNDNRFIDYSIKDSKVKPVYQQKTLSTVVGFDVSPINQPEHNANHALT